MKPTANHPHLMSSNPHLASPAQSPSPGLSRKGAGEGQADRESGGPAIFADNPIAAAGDSPPAPPAAEMRSVVFTYSVAATPALRGIDLTLKAGEMIGIMGASGAGKSTLAKCLNRLVPAFERGEFSGVVSIRGRTLDGARVSDVAPLVGMVFQDFEAQLFSTNVALEVAFTMQQIGMPREEIAARIEPALAAVGLSGFAHRDPTSLSGGEKQRLAIAAVLALRPGIIVLDEPTTDLDPEGKAEVFALIRKLREQGLSLIVIEHEADELRGCDRLLVLRDGQAIAQGPPASVMTQLEMLETCGVHPPDLNRALALLGIHAHAATTDEAEALIRRTFTISRGPAAQTRLITAMSQGVADGSVTHVNPAGHSIPPLDHEKAERGLSDAPLAEAEQLYFSYPLGPRVLDAINFRIHPGEFAAIVGQNGSGKTTLAKHLVGLLTPSGGRVLLEGRDRAALRPAETAHKAGYVFQNPDHQIFASTVEAEIAFGPRNFGLSNDEVEQRVAEVLHAVNLEDARERDPFLLSKGERQRLAVASVLALRPQLLILDEPTTGLDYREQRRMMGLVRDLNRAGIAIIIITHAPWLVAEYARRAVLMRQGRILFDGPVDQFFQQDELLRQSSFRPPEVTLLARRFGLAALSPEEFASAIRELARTDKS
ncbi:MAG: energy-coupling factor ABC transporter ATP-binding protein [Deltaproteobacteria bacterium]|nr:energy-coupling factor ABC transporter ATP-binding protein [Deltaproteobacteria bacterium]